MMNNRKRLIAAVITLNDLFLRQITELEDLEEIEDGDVSEDMIVFEMALQLEPRQCNIPRIENYFEITIPRYTPKQFQGHFRITIEAYQSLCALLIPMLHEDYETGRRLKLPHKQMLAVLWLLATPDSYRSVGETFNIAKSALSDAFVRVILQLVKLAPQVIKWPRGAEAVGVESKFRAISGFENVIGAVDGTFIPIKAPKLNSEVYITRKCNYAMTLQAIAEPSLRFTDCFIGYPGSVSDSRIFRNSYIYQDIQASYLDFFQDNTFIIGDKAYPLLKWCIPPYIERRRLTDIQRNFNSIHSKTRCVVERTFALFFGRFRRLRYLDMNRVDLISATVIAACVLHNICINHTDLLLEDFIQQGQHFMRNDNGEDNIVNHNYFLDAGITPHQIRDQIALHLYNQHRDN